MNMESLTSNRYSLFTHIILILPTDNDALLLGPGSEVILLRFVDASHETHKKLVLFPWNTKTSFINGLTDNVRRKIVNIDENENDFFVVPDCAKELRFKTEIPFEAVVVVLIAFDTHILIIPNSYLHVLAQVRAKTVKDLRLEKPFECWAPEAGEMCEMEWI